MLKSSYVNHVKSIDINSQPNQVDMDIVTQSPVTFNPLTQDVEFQQLRIP